MRGLSSKIIPGVLSSCFTNTEQIVTFGTTYSFSFLGLAQGTQHDISMNRTYEKSTCKGELGTNSCNHYSKESNTFIQFLWKLVFGDYLCDDISRDACGSVDRTNTTNCLTQLFKGATSKDILVVGSLPADSTMWCKNNCTLGNTFNLFFDGLSKPGVLTYDLMVATVKRLLTLFPGRILWVSFPHVKDNNVTLNSMIVDINIAMSKAVKDASANMATAAAMELTSDQMWTGCRAQYVNISPLQKEHLSSYIDTVHHPGLLSELIVKYLLSILTLN